MNEKPRRRWFRFSLATLFVLVTLVALWVGWSMNWIRQRRYVIAHSVGWQTDGKTDEPVTAPAFLWLFGEPGYSKIWVMFGPDNPRKITDAEKAFANSFAKLFPESESVAPAIRTYARYPGTPDEPTPFPPMP